METFVVLGLRLPFRGARRRGCRHAARFRMLYLLGLDPPMKLVTTSGLLVLLLALSIACGGSGDAPTTSQDILTATPGPMSTDGPIWVAERLNGKPVIGLWRTVLALSTYEESAGGNDGCNRIFGSHEDGSHVAQPDGTISFPGLGQTLAGCPWGMERQSESYQEALADAKQYQIQGHRLRIRDRSGKVRLVMVNKSPLVGVPKDLTGTAWRLVSTDGKTPRGRPPTLAFWDEAFVGGTVSNYGFVAQYDNWRTSFRVRSVARIGDEPRWFFNILNPGGHDFLRSIRGSGAYAVREEDGTRLLRIRTVRGYPLDFQELMPAVDNIADTEWRLQSFIEVRREEYRYGGPPCVAKVLPGSDIVARFTEQTVSGTVDGRKYSRDDVSLTMVRPGESSTDGLAGLDPRYNDLPDGRCPREDGEEASERDTAGQAERYLELLPQLRRYMIFGDRLVVLTDSHQALLFQAERSDG